MRNALEIFTFALAVLMASDARSREVAIIKLNELVNLAHQDHNFFLDVVVGTKPIGSLVDFNTSYGPLTGQNLVNGILSAMKDMGKGDALLFKSPVYGFKGKLETISKILNISKAVFDIFGKPVGIFRLPIGRSSANFLRQDFVCYQEM